LAQTVLLAKNVSNFF